MIGKTIYNPFLPSFAEFNGKGSHSNAAADPGFLIGGVPTHWGVPTSNMGVFWQKRE